MSDLKELRKSKHLTQQEAAFRIGVSLRSYISYENEETKKGSPKYRFLLQELEKINPIDEEHGVLERDELINICSEILSEYDVDYCYLFGSYAKNTQHEGSDYDFYVVMPDDAGNEILLGQKAYRSLRGLRKTPVDIVVGHESAFEKLKTQPTIEREVARDGILLYEK